MADSGISPLARGREVRHGQFPPRLPLRPIFRWARKVLPSLSATEREAIEAGDTWWDADIFTGNPDWNKMLAFPPAKLTAEEQAFLDGPVEELCGMLDEWSITERHTRTCRLKRWEFLKAKKFFAMIIPKQYGGLGFGHYAHSEVVRKLSTRSITARGDGDGAELARAGRTPDDVRHAGAARLLAAAARGWNGDPLLRPSPRRKPAPTPPR